MLDDPLTKKEAKEMEKEKQKDSDSKKPETGSSILLQLGQERRGLIRDKYYKRIGEEQFLKL